MSKKSYQVAPGIDWVNGARVPENREVKLSAAEAKFDLDQGRITLKDDGAPDEQAAQPQAQPAAPARSDKRKTTA